jgi:hypothetical protein
MGELGQKHDLEASSPAHFEQQLVAGLLNMALLKTLSSELERTRSREGTRNIIVAPFVMRLIHNLTSK